MPAFFLFVCECFMEATLTQPGIRAFFRESSPARDHMDKALFPTEEAAEVIAVVL